MDYTKRYNKKDIMSMFEVEITLDNPVFYKELPIHPVRVKDYKNFEKYITPLLIEKEDYGFIFVKMKKIDFLNQLMCIGSKTYADIVPADSPIRQIAEYEKLGASILYLFMSLFEMVFRGPFKFEFRFSEKKILLFVSFEAENELKRIEINDTDLHNLKTIIMTQNVYFYDDAEYSKDVLELIDMTRKSESSRDKKPTFEEKIVSLSVGTGMTIDYIINSLTLKKMAMLFERMEMKINYELLEAARLSGNITLKNKEGAPSWTRKVTHSKVEGLFADYGKVSSQIGQQNEGNTGNKKNKKTFKK